MRAIRLSFRRIPKPQSSTPQLLETASRSVTPSLWISAMSTLGTPQRPNPPTASDEPLTMPSTASAALETTLSMEWTLAVCPLGGLNWS